MYKIKSIIPGIVYILIFYGIFLISRIFILVIKNKEIYNLYLNRIIK